MILYQTLLAISMLQSTSRLSSDETTVGSWRASLLPLFARVTGTDLSP